jgi:hypothetical protein
VSAWRPQFRVALSASAANPHPRGGSGSTDNAFRNRERYQPFDAQRRKSVVAPRPLRLQPAWRQFSLCRNWSRSRSRKLSTLFTLTSSVLEHVDDEIPNISEKSKLDEKSH